MLLKLTCSLLMGFGLWLLTSEIRQTDKGNVDSVIRYFGSKTEKSGLSDAVIGALASRISVHIKLSEERKKELQYELTASHLTITPEYYIGENIACAVFVLATGLLLGTVAWKGFYIVGVVGAVAAYRYEEDRTAKEKKRIEGVIDSCMPEFAVYVCSYVKIDHNVMEILTRYRNKCTEPVLKKELDITIADASSSGIESALIRFDARAHSAQLSSIVRALISLANGNYRQEHFEQLEAQFETHEKERLAKQAQDTPEKLKPYNYAIYIAFTLMMLVLFFTLFMRFSSEIF